MAATIQFPLPSPLIPALHALQHLHQMKPFHKLPFQRHLFNYNYSLPLCFIAIWVPPSAILIFPIRFNFMTFSLFSLALVLFSFFSGVKCYYCLIIKSINRLHPHCHCLHYWILLHFRFNFNFINYRR